MLGAACRYATPPLIVTRQRDLSWNEYDVQPVGSSVIWTITDYGNSKIYGDYGNGEIYLRYAKIAGGTVLGYGAIGYIIANAGAPNEWLGPQHGNEGGPFGVVAYPVLLPTESAIVSQFSIAFSTIGYLNTNPICNIDHRLVFTSRRLTAWRRIHATTPFNITVEYPVTLAGPGICEDAIYGINEMNGVTGLGCAPVTDDTFTTASQQLTSQGGSLLMIARTDRTPTSVLVEDRNLGVGPPTYTVKSYVVGTPRAIALDEEWEITNSWVIQGDT